MSANTGNLVDAETALDLNNIRASLMRMEDSIIFSLIERAQYRVNGDVYQGDCKKLDPFRLHQLKSAGSIGCLGDWYIYQTECLHAQVGRYSHHTEYPFFGPLPEPMLAPDNAEPEPKKARKDSSTDILHKVPDEAIINKRILEIYREKIVPAICAAGDDGNHGSVAVQDVHVLQTMATRCYYGLFVAESKFRTETEKATAMIKAKDRDGLMAFITKPEVEKKNVERVILKARTFSQTIAAAQPGQLAPPDPGPSTSYKIDPVFVGEVFRDFLMPLTKDVEVEYLLARLS